MIDGRLLVAADGARSALATACGVDWLQQPYEQLAVIANVTTSVPHDGRAFERFTQYGPLAMLPMSDGRCSLVWCHPLEQRDEIMALSTNSFAVNYKPLLAGDWDVLPGLVNAALIRFR